MLNPNPSNQKSLSRARVSIIIPAFNAAETIADTLNSLINQTYPDWEAIIIDDGSTERTQEVISKYVE